MPLAKPDLARDIDVGLGRDVRFGNHKWSCDGLVEFWHMFLDM